MIMEQGEESKANNPPNSIEYRDSCRPPIYVHQLRSTAESLHGSDHGFYATCVLYSGYYSQYDVTVDNPLLSILKSILRDH